MLPLVPHTVYKSLGGPPSFDTITRDTFVGQLEGGMKNMFTPYFVMHILIVSFYTCAYICVYLCNIYVDTQTHTNTHAGYRRCLSSLA